jgi:HTH-type transcriptional regulator / antitoxin HipB
MAAADPHDRAADDLARVVRQRRSSLGLRQEDLADLADVSLRFVQSVEAGKTTVRLDKVTALLDVLGLQLTAEPVRRGTR